MSLSSLSIAHGETVAAIHQEVFDEHWSLKAFQDLISLPASFGFICEKEGEPVGFILCQGDEIEAEIITIGTRLMYQRQGIAQDLLHAALQKTQRMFLEVATDNIKAKNFYEKMGFRQIGLRKNYYKRPGNLSVDALVMEFETK